MPHHLFNPHAPVIPKILANMSGLSKTKVVLEALCKAIGLYFTCANDTIGSSNLQFILVDLHHCSGFSGTLLNTPLSKTLQDTGKQHLE